MLALGARARAAIPGAVTFRDQRDAHLIARLVEALQNARRPSCRVRRPLRCELDAPLYELALLTAAEIERRGLAVETMPITPEATPLRAFGPGVSDRIGALLADRGIRRLRGVAHSVGRGRLTLTSGEAVQADRVVAVPRLVGRRVTGVPADWSGFVPTDHHGRVRDVPDVFAAGDMTQLRIKQGGLATQQADVIAAVLAATRRSRCRSLPVRQRAPPRLLVAGGPLYLRAGARRRGAAAARDRGAADLHRGPVVAAPKLFGRYLSPWMAARDPVAA